MLYREHTEGLHLRGEICGTHLEPSISRYVRVVVGKAKDPTALLNSKGGQVEFDREIMLRGIVLGICTGHDWVRAAECGAISVEGSFVQNNCVDISR
jgi:hypothetical protein